MKLTKLSSIFIAAMLSVLVFGVNKLTAGASIIGGGTATVSSLFDRCNAGYRSAGNVSNLATYSVVGSGAGRTNFGSGVYDFGFTDSPFRPASGAPADLTYVPFVATPIAVTYRIDSLAMPLRLRPITLARIFSGDITNWNDSQITGDNGSRLSSIPITVVHRKDGAAVTNAFTSYLREVAPEVWTKPGNDAFASAFPGTIPTDGSFRSAQGNEGVTNFVRDNDGSITYAALSFQKEREPSVSAARIQNRNNEYISPSIESVGIAALSIPAANRDGDSGWLTPDFTTSAQGAYPLFHITHAMAHKSYSESNDAVGSLLRFFLTSCLDTSAVYEQQVAFTYDIDAFVNSRVSLIASIGRPTGVSSPRTTFVPRTTTTTSTVAPAATTTIASATTSTITVSPSLTTVGGVTSTTAAISLTKPSASTTTAPRSVQSSNAVPVATTTTSTTSSTSTSTTLPPVVAPRAPAASPGSATALIGGIRVQLRVVRGNNSLEITSASIQLKLQIVKKDGTIIPLDVNGNAVLSQYSFVKYSITSAKPGAVLDAWLFSEPIKLGTVVVGEDGRVSGLLPVNDVVPAGDHRLVFKTRTATGDDATVAVGVIVGEIGGGVSIGLLIFATLIAAVMAGLILPATRRRRKTREALGMESLS